MKRGEARTALEAARRWKQRGMFKDGAYEHIEQELAPIAAEGEPSLAMQSFYAIGGVMLGAATAALFGLLVINDLADTDRSAWWFFAIFAFLFMGIAVAIHAMKQRELGDSMIIASLVPTAILLGPGAPEDILLFIPVVVGLAVAVWRRGAYLVPILGIALSSVALPLSIFQTLGNDWSFGDAAAWAWFILSVLLIAAIVAWSRIEELRWDSEAIAGTGLAASFAWIVLVDDVIQPNFDGGYEVIIALFLGALIGLGVILKERMLTFVAGIALAIDAIVFAFDIGGPTTGLVVLLLMAGGLITAATLLRRKRPSSPTPVARS